MDRSFESPAWCALACGSCHTDTSLKRHAPNLTFFFGTASHTPKTRKHSLAVDAPAATASSSAHAKPLAGTEAAAAGDHAAQTAAGWRVIRSTAYCDKLVCSALHASAEVHELCCASWLQARRSAMANWCCWTRAAGQSEVDAFTRVEIRSRSFAESAPAR